MALRMVVLLAVLGEVFSWIVGAFAIPYAWIGFAIIFPIFGAIAGLGQGVLEGVVLWVVTVLVHRRGIPGDSVWYRRIAELVCVVVSLVALALFFEITARMSGTSFIGGPAYDSDDVEEGLLLVAGPSLLAAGASWWAARKVASQYARETAAG
jgi:hypothetical protein